MTATTMLHNANNAVALVLTSAEAHALFEAAALGLSKRAESGMTGSRKVVDALQKIERGMRVKRP